MMVQQLVYWKFNCVHRISGFFLFLFLFFLFRIRFWSLSLMIFILICKSTAVFYSALHRLLMKKKKKRCSCSFFYEFFQNEPESDFVTLPLKWKQNYMPIYMFWISIGFGSVNALKSILHEIFCWFWFGFRFFTWCSSNDHSR